MQASGDQTFSHPYARPGLFGVMVPYGNFATEWELSVLIPRPGFFITTRLTDDGGDLLARLGAYFDPARLDRAMASFGSTPLVAVGIACSATSYLLGRAGEDAVFSALASRHRAPFVRAASAMQAGLEALGTRTLELVSPYPPAITAHCVRYWREQGYEVASVHQLTNPRPGFHPIYTLTPCAVEAALREVVGRARAPVLMTGTGLSSLPAIRALLREGGPSGPPILSATTCMARAMLREAGTASGAADDWFTAAAAWLDAPQWDAAAA